MSQSGGVRAFGETRQRELLPGESFGTYRIVRELGRGGMGVVYEAESEADGRSVALKLLGAGLVEDVESRARFLREGRMAAGVMHPNAVYVYGTAEIEGTPVIAMELVPGGTLEALIERDGPLPVADMLAYARQLVDGLEAAAAAGVLHRDVKPSNCFLEGAGRVKIGDFGLSRPSERAVDVRLTQTGSLMGTPAFAAPEQLLGEALDFRADIYSLGATLWFLLTGRTPFGGANAPQLLAAVLQGRLPSLQELRPDVTPRVVAVLERCLARQPDARFASYAELRDALSEGSAGLGEPAGPWQRFGAAFVDLLLLSAPVLVLEAAWTSPDVPPLVEFAAYAVSFLLAKAIPEHRFGASLGKMLFGVRLMALAGHRPSLASSMLRALVWTVVFSWDSILDAVFGVERFDSGVVVIAYACIPLLFMLPMRASNGYATALDLLLKTRVVRRRAGGASLRYVNSATRLSPNGVLSEFAGPYRLGSTLFVRPDGSWVRAANDEALSRTLWIHLVRPDTPAVSAPRRVLARGARLRWIAGERGPDGGWDAYGAPEGRLLLDLPAPVPWSRCAAWLDDIAQETAAAVEEGAAPSFRAGDVWIADGEQALLLDFAEAARSVYVADDSYSLGTALQQVARRALLGPSWGAAVDWPRLPVSARRFLRELPGRNDATAIRGALSELTGVPDAATARQIARARVPLSALYGMLVLTLLAIVGEALHLTEEQRTLTPFANYLMEQEQSLTDTSAARADSAAVATGSANAREESRRAARDSFPERRAVIETWLRLRHGAMLRDSARMSAVSAGGVFDVDSLDIARRLSILTRVAKIDASALEVDEEKAVRLVEREWSGRPPGYSVWDVEPLSTAAVCLLMLFVSLVFGGLCSVLTPLLIGRGPFLRSASLQIADAEGVVAGRVRLALRAAVNWAPILLCVPIGVLLLFVERVTRSASPEAYAAGATQQLVMLTLVASLVAGLFMLTRIWLRPLRTPGDHVADTWIVPE